MSPSRIVFLVGSLLAVAVPAHGQDAGRLIVENGVTYREFRETVRRPTAEVTYDERKQTSYRVEVKEELRELKHTIYVPVTQYRWEPYRQGSLNPFTPTTIAYRWAPHTYWQPQTATLHVPAKRQHWVPEKRTVKVPTRTLKFVQEERVRRVAVTPSPTGGATIVATRPHYGSVGRLDTDPPRIGPRTATIRR